MLLVSDKNNQQLLVIAPSMDQNYQMEEGVVNQLVG
jgi:hypothetical protein